MAQRALYTLNLPGIGTKTAQRLAYYVLKMPREKAVEFSQAIISAHDNIHYCNARYHR